MNQNYLDMIGGDSIAAKFHLGTHCKFDIISIHSMFLRNMESIHISIVQVTLKKQSIM